VLDAVFDVLQPHRDQRFFVGKLTASRRPSFPTMVLMAWSADS
jgi:hypothetical protein